ncbi:MAG: hypothetical protein E6446_01905 [Gemella haemolysans]|nr:hypothetical protein [Gemella haemolysans]
MNREEIQEKFEQIASAIDWIKTKLFELQEEKGLAPVKTSYEVEVPEDIGNYYFVSECGAINLLKDVFFSVDYEKVYLRGLAFKTKEEAEQFDKERILINRAKDWAKKYNEGWKPDWGDFSKYNHAVTYDYCEKFYVKSYSCVNFLSKLPYFKTQELAEQFIEEFGDEIKEVLC